ncbi:MAG TPA: rhodanese-like domain-containing protein [Macromonas sp.]|nr:rhodanese-like domain-containing protein [Macromonas sp.]
MTFLIENWMLIAVVVVSGGLLLRSMLAKNGGANGLTPAEAVQLMNREKAVVVDVCSAEEYAQGHLKGARNIPLPELQDKLSDAVKNKQLPLILVCASGMRSSKAVGVAHKLGYEKAFSLTGGMKAWRDAELPVIKG